MESLSSKLKDSISQKAKNYKHLVFTIDTDAPRHRHRYLQHHPIRGPIGSETQKKTHPNAFNHQ